MERNDLGLGYLEDGDCRQQLCSVGMTLLVKSLLYRLIFLGSWPKPAKPYGKKGATTNPTACCSKNKGDIGRIYIFNECTLGNAH